MFDHSLSFVQILFSALTDRLWLNFAQQQPQGRSFEARSSLDIF